MKFVLVTVALISSTSAFGAVETSPPTELPGCELVGTVKNVKIWAGECEPSVRNGVPVGSTVVPVAPPPPQPGRGLKK
jgi:anti-sigma factor RsiW